MAAAAWGQALSAALAADAGRRDFPATLVVEEPQVETEIAPQFAALGTGTARRSDVSSDLSIQITRSLSVLVNPDYTRLRPGGGGFQALEIGLKAQFVTDAAHEVVVSAGLLSALGGTGSARVDAESSTSIIPTLFYGKGGGDLPAAMAWARPFALTGQVALAIPTRLHPPAVAAAAADGDLSFESNATLLGLAGSLQYNLGYLAEVVLSHPLPGSLAGFIPLVEYEVAVPIANRGVNLGASSSGSAQARTVGTVNPGVLYVDAPRSITLGLEALIPINRASGTHPGARLQLSYSFPSPFLPAAAGDAD